MGDWDRSDLTITATKANLSTQFVIDVASTGQHFELETNAIMGIGGFTSKFVDALGITTQDKPTPKPADTTDTTGDTKEDTKDGEA